MTGTDRETALWDNLRQAEAALSSDIVIEARKRAEDLGIEAGNLDDALNAVQTNRAKELELIALAEGEAAEARQAIKDFYTAGGQPDPAEDVHAAVKAMAEEAGFAVPEDEAKVTEDEALMGEDVTRDNFAHTIPSEGPSDWVLAARDKLSLCAGDEAMAFEPFDAVTDDLPAFADLSPAEQAEVVAVLDDDEPFVALADEAPQDRLVIGRASDVSEQMLAEARVADEREEAGRKQFNPWR